MRYLEMSEEMREQMWTELGDKVEPAWTPERDWAVRAAITRRARRQRVVVRTMVAVGSAGVLAAGGFALVSLRLAAGPAAPAVSDASRARSAPPAAGRSETVEVTHL